MDTIWHRKSFEVGGHWPLWRGLKNQMTTQNRQKSNAKKKNPLTVCMFLTTCMYQTSNPHTWLCLKKVVKKLHSQSVTCTLKWQ